MDGGRVLGRPSIYRDCHGRAATPALLSVAFLDLTSHHPAVQALSTTEELIITAERDEKIRVSHFPNSYNIESFCLGHTAHVNALAVHGLSPDQGGPGDLLVSGAVDGSLRLWRLPCGQPLHTFNLGELVAAAVVSGDSVHAERAATSGSSPPGIEAIALAPDCSRGAGNLCQLAVTFTSR
eukprot:COSAG05_NODE_461_length_9571_cov_14.935283_8_plen_181_part_00